MQHVSKYLLSYQLVLEDQEPKDENDLKWNNKLPWFLIQNGLNPLNLSVMNMTHVMLCDLFCLLYELSYGSERDTWICCT
jgi:hypothetical protein